MYWPRAMRGPVGDGSMTEENELPTTSLLITDLGGYTYRLTFGNQRRHVAIIASGSQLERWAGEIRAAIGATSASRTQYTYHHNLPGSGVERAG